MVFSNKLLCRAPSPAITWIGVQKCLYSSDVKPLRASKLPAMKRGTGGRSSFSGTIVTVFGATGFVGSHLVNRFGKKGSQVIIPYRGDDYRLMKYKPMGDLGQILFSPYNLKDEESLYKAMKYSNIVVNCIGRDFETRNFKFDDVHVKGARSIARIARECGVDRLLHLSALNCDREHAPILLPKGSQFLRTKAEGEEAVKSEFPNATIFRPADIFGIDDTFLNYYASVARHNVSKMPLWNKGEGVYKQPVYISDFVDGIMSAAFDRDTVGKTYQAVGPSRYELSELVDWFHRCMRQTKEYGYRRTNLKYDPIFQARISFCEFLSPIYTSLTWEKVEREHITDVVDKSLPTLEDLGVKLTPIEAKGQWQLHLYRKNASFDEDLIEIEPPQPPKVVPA